MYGYMDVWDVSDVWTYGHMDIYGCIYMDINIDIWIYIDI
jgi:hypothetical protein